MSRAGTKLIRAAKEAQAIVRGEADSETYRVHVPERIDVEAIRSGLNLTPQMFATTFGFSLSALRKWERGDRVPEGPTRAYLRVIERDPDAVRKALQEPVAAE